nr:tetratricopeptide repeat protein [Streptomyces coryli]
MTAVAGELAAVYAQLFGRPYPRPEPRLTDLRADGHNNHALSLLDLGDPDGATRSFAAALAADPQHPRATYNAGLLRWRRGEVSDVGLVTELESVRTAVGDSWRARLLLAQVHLERGDLDAARGLLEQLPRDEPEVREVVRALDSGRVVDARGVEVEAAYVPSLLPADGTARFATGGRGVVLGKANGTVSLWDPATGKLLRALDGHRSRVRAVDVTADARLAASAGEDGTLRVWDLDSRACLHTLDAPYGTGGDWDTLSRAAIRLAPDGGRLLWVRDGVAVLFDLRTGARAVLAEEEQGAAAEFGPDGTRLVLALTRQLAVLDPAGGDRTHLTVLPEQHQPTALRLSRDGRLAAIGTNHGPIHVWDLPAGRPVRTLSGHKYGVAALSFDADARRLLSGASDQSVRLWDLDTGQCLRTFYKPGSTGPPAPLGLLESLPVADVRLAGDARTAMSAGRNSALHRWQLPSAYAAPPALGRPRAQPELARLATRVTDRLAEAEAERVAGRHREAVRLLAAVRATPGYEREPEVLAAWRRLAAVLRRTGLRAAWPGRTLGETGVMSVDVTGDGRVAATGGYLGEIKIWDAEVGTLLREMRLPERPHPDPERNKSHPVRQVSLSADGRRLLTASRGEVRLWDTGTGACLRVLDGTDHHSRTACFAGDETLAMIGSGDDSVHLRDLTTGELRWSATEEPGDDRLQGQPSGIAATVWAQAGGRLAATAAGLDGYVRLTDLATGRLLHRIKAHLFSVAALCLSPDERLLLTAGSTGEAVIRLWDVASGTQIRQFRYDTDRHGHDPVTVRFTPDGRFAVTGGRDETAVVWDVVTGRSVRIIEGLTSWVEAAVPTAHGHRLLTSARGVAPRLWELDWELARFPAGR